MWRLSVLRSSLSLEYLLPVGMGVFSHSGSLFFTGLAGGRDQSEDGVRTAPGGKFLHHSNLLDITLCSVRRGCVPAPREFSGLSSSRDSSRLKNLPETKSAKEGPDSRALRVSLIFPFPAPSARPGSGV